MDFLLRRRQRLSGLLPKEQVDAFLITHPINVSYLTGFSGDSSFLIITRKHSILVSDARFTTQIEEDCPGLDAYVRPPSQTIFQAVATVIDKLGCRIIGFESGCLTVADLETLRSACFAIEWKGARDRVERLRACKDPTEIAQIRAAIGIAEKAFAMFQAMLRPDDSEKALADNLETYIRRAGGRSSSFPSIVAVGDRSALPHAPVTEKRVHEAGWLLVDWGASGPFYKSDLTRVLATRKISPKLDKVYAVVLKAQERAMRAIRPGVTGHAIDAEARSVIDQAGFGQFFGHGLGHGLGLQVHESPSLRQNSEAVLQAGMVVTIEPGIYLPGWGGVRIEDDVLVTPDGCEVLSSLPKDPIPAVGF